jgi:transposase
MAASDRRRVRTDMELWSEIRRKVLVEGVSKRQICREYGLGWWTLEKMLAFTEPPGYRRRVPRGRPRLGAFVGDRRDPGRGR